MIEYAKNSLFEAKEILDNLKIKFFLFCGTALGAYRDGAFCENDENDIDLAVMDKHFKKIDKIREAFKAKGFIEHRLWIFPDNIAPEVSFVKKYPEFRSKVDIFFLTKHGKKILWRLYNDVVYACKTKVLEQNYFGKSDKIVFYGKEFNIPTPIEPYLKENYDNWREKIPRKEWNWWESNKCKTL